jgi:hypothetical protein
MAGGRSMLDALFNTPGFHSSHPETWGAAAPVPLSKITSEHMSSIRGKEIKAIWVDEFAEITMKEDDMSDKTLEWSLDETDGGGSLTVLAAQLTEMLKVAEPTSFMLGEPMSLTVKKKDGTYSKHPHIGGENFIPVSAYAGKKGSLIFVFRADHVTSYAEMEMGEAQADVVFTGFKEYIKNAVARGLTHELREAKAEAAKDAELKANAEKFERYADLGFGSF